MSLQTYAQIQCARLQRTLQRLHGQLCVVLSCSVNSSTSDLCLTDFEHVTDGSAVTLSPACERTEVLISARLTRTVATRADDSNLLLQSVCAVCNKRKCQLLQKRIHKRAHRRPCESSCKQNTLYTLFCHTSNKTLVYKSVYKRVYKCLCTHISTNPMHAP